MNRDDVIDVLSVIAAHDRRTIGEADVILWQNVIGELPVDTALKAVRDHIREEPGVWLESGHVYRRARGFIRDQLEREPDEVREARQAVLGVKAAADDAERTPWTGPPKHARRPANPLLVRCPHCGASPGKHCTAPGSHRPPHGGMHPARINEALDRESAS